MASGLSGEYLFASGPHETTQVWNCRNCDKHGTLTDWYALAPRKHVSESGHQVILSRLETQELFPIRTRTPD